MCSRYCTMVSVDSVDPETCCAVCLKAFEQKQTKKRVFVKKLKCGHVFHGSCIDKWLARAHNCPCCREALQLVKDPCCVIENIDMILVDHGRRQLVSYADLYF
jgi:hypothetical protein